MVEDWLIHPDLWKYAQGQLVKKLQSSDYINSGPMRKSIKQTITQTEQQITNLVFKLVELRVLIAPIRRLPSEILARILTEHFESTTGIDPDSTRAQVACPQRFAPLSVCRYWRQTALECPACWTHFVLTLPLRLRNSTMANCLKRLETLLAVQLSRAGDLPLDLVLNQEFYSNDYTYFPPTKYSDSVETRKRVLSTLQCVATRIRSFIEIGYGNSIIFNAFDLSSAARLTYLRIRGIFDLNAPKGSYSLPALRSLHVGSMNGWECLTIFSCPNLEDLSLRVYTNIPDDEAESAVDFGEVLQVFPRLRSMAVDRYLASRLSSIQHHSMERVKLHQYNTSFQWTSLMMTHTDSLDKICNFLCAFPNVNALTISHFGLSGPTGPSEPLAILQNIKELRLEGPMLVNISTTRSALMRFSAVTKVAITIHDTAPLWEGEDDECRTLLPDFLGELDMGGELVLWPRLEILELLSLELDKTHLGRLFDALEIRNRVAAQRGGKPCLLTLKGCSFVPTRQGGSTEEELLPDADCIDWPEITSRFKSFSFFKKERKGRDELI